MTEAQWLASADPRAMTNKWPWPVSERKARLFACACCRRIWPLLTAPGSRRAVEVSERLADGKAREGARQKAHDAATAVTRRERAYAPAAAETASGRLIRESRKTASVLAWAGRAASHAHEAAYQGAYSDRGTNDRRAFDAGNWAKEYECAVQADLLRDIFGNPFRPVAFDPAWRTSTAVTLARQMYESRDFGPLPILADALQDAGCDTDDVLTHCRAAGAPHVRGCWVVDGVLGLV